MSLLSKLKQDAKAARRKVRDTSTDEVKRKAAQDVRAAERHVRSAKDEAKRQAKQDAETARRRLRRKKEAARRRARQQAAEARETGVTGGARKLIGELRKLRVDPDGDGGVDAPGTTREVVERAGEAATLRSPVSATLDPGADGPAMEEFARASPGLMREAGQRGAGLADETRGRQRDPDPLGVTVGMTAGAGGVDDEGGDPLVFDDALGVAAGGLDTDERDRDDDGEEVML